MAELNMPQKNGKRKVQVPRIDLTPMVDLGFLLITFFMYTTTLANAKRMEINMPDKGKVDDPTVFVAEATITVMPTKNHKVIYYYGALSSVEDLKETTANNILSVLLAKKGEVARLPASFSADAHKLHVIIKPREDCKYEDVVQMLDDMIIADVKTYVLTDITKEEDQWIKEKF